MKNNFVLFLIVALSILIGYLLGNEKELLTIVDAGGSRMNRLERLLTYIENDYVEKINTDSLVGVVIEDIVERLDPHYVYIPSFLCKKLSKAHDLIGIISLMLD